MILKRFKNNHCIYYAFLTAYCTGLRVAEVFALTWDDIDFNNKTITVNKNILKKNQVGGTKSRHTKANGKYVGRNILNYPFKVIHDELEIKDYRFYFFKKLLTKLDEELIVEISSLNKIVLNERYFVVKYKLF